MSDDLFSSDSNDDQGQLLIAPVLVALEKAAHSTSSFYGSGRKLRKRTAKPPMPRTPSSQGEPIPDITDSDQGSNWSRKASARDIEGGSSSDSQIPRGVKRSRSSSKNE